MDVDFLMNPPFGLIESVICHVHQSCLVHAFFSSIFYICFLFLSLLRSKVKSINYKNSFGKCYDRTSTLDSAIVAQKWSKGLRGKSELIGHLYSLLMDLGQNEQQNHTVNSERVRRGRVSGCGCYR